MRAVFDYLPPPGLAATEIPVGARVVVRVGRRRLVGLVCEAGVDACIEPARLRPALACLDSVPLIDAQTLALIRFAADYYHHPIGEVAMNALPGLLREDADLAAGEIAVWRLASGAGTAHPAVARAPRQRALLAHFEALGGGQAHGADALAGFGDGWRATLRQLLGKGLVLAERRSCLAPARGGGVWPTPHAAQAEAVEAIWPASGEMSFAAHLLEGVTGSGKTEVYLRLIERALAAGRQALVLVPEIGLTPQLLVRFRERFAVPIAALHSGLGDGERRCAWLTAARGEAPIVIGTRSAVFTPMPGLGLIVVDEEHDASFKQQENLRYHARDLAIWRGRAQGARVVLGSATPSLETLHHARAGRYGHQRLLTRAGAAKPPRLRLLDIRHKRLDAGLSAQLLAAVGERLAAGEQVLLFLNRRGFAPVLICQGCGWVARCPRCDTPMTYHAQARSLRCHHCDRETRLPEACPECGQVDPMPLGQGTERLETVLAARFPDAGVLRIDRDTTRRRGALAERLEAVHSGEYPLLVGTQMLTKGHHFPSVTLVGVIDADQGLYSVDYRAHERLAQLLVQVAGRAGREQQPGEVMIQTGQPEHPLLITLLRDGYPAAAELILGERRATGMPPYSHLALLRAEAPGEAAPVAFLAAAAMALRPLAARTVDLLGPVPAPMPRRAGRYRAQLLLRAGTRAPLHRLLQTGLSQLDALPEARRVRWSLDVDPVDLY
ncbi:Helicase PriA [Acidihalobacter prosperus]|uniref:Replication restart protein PriA n=1 Tax=Acidihalobacter prosperus TaxID=160660 RepID=A0A1A6C4G1_9GAMM|nr:Helicase PriA [Acidihalobacter prosperus]